MPFIIDSIPPTNSDSYLAPRPNGNGKPVPHSIPTGEITKGLLAPDKTKFLYLVSPLINVYRLCIPLSVAPDILAVTYGKGYPGFSRCYKILMHFWFIHGVAKLFRAFICHYLQCLVFQTSQYAPYKSFQLIVSPFILLFILTLDFMLALSLLREKYNVIMSVTCKFSKSITLIKSTDIYSAEQCTNIFFNRLNLINWGLPGELITNCNPKFFSKFLTALFAKLGVKLFYNTAYHPQTDGSSKRTN